MKTARRLKASVALTLVFMLLLATALTSVPYYVRNGALSEGGDVAVAIAPDRPEPDPDSNHSGRKISPSETGLEVWRTEYSYSERKASSTVLANNTGRIAYIKGSLYDYERMQPSDDYASNISPSHFNDQMNGTFNDGIIAEINESNAAQGVVDHSGIINDRFYFGLITGGNFVSYNDSGWSKTQSGVSSGVIAGANRPRSEQNIGHRGALLGIAQSVLGVQNSMYEFKLATYFMGIENGVYVEKSYTTYNNMNLFPAPTKPTPYVQYDGNDLAASPATISAYHNLQLPFLLDDDGYFTFNSEKYHFHVYNNSTSGDGKLDLYAGKQMTSASDDSTEFTHGSGWFPFNNFDGDTYAHNTYFGMRLDVEFMMPENGQIDGKDMIFEFVGDDDMWVYIDGKLALDIGGAHTATKGEINFRDGIATVDAYGKISSPSSITTYSATQNKRTWQLYSNAGYTEGNQGYIGGGTTPTSGITNKAFERHTLTVFYMERHGTDSNCYIRFNLPIVPPEPNVLTVKKTVDETLKSSDADYIFNIYSFNDNYAAIVDPEIEYGIDAQWLENDANWSPSIPGSTTSFTATHSRVVGNGAPVITLTKQVQTIKQGESFKLYTFRGAGNRWIRVIEQIDDSYYTDNSNVGELYSASGFNTDSGWNPYVMPQLGVQSTWINSNLFFFNSKIPYGKLKVSKVLEGNAANYDDAFLFEIMFEKNGLPSNDTYYGVIEKSDGTFINDVPLNNLNGLFTLRGDECISIAIPENIKYKVIEVDANTNSYETVVTGNGSSVTDTNSVVGMTGLIVLQQESIVLFTNTKNIIETGSLTVKKVLVSDGTDTEKLFSFRVTFADANGTREETFKLSGGNSKTFSNIITGAAYFVEELDADQGGYKTTHSGNVTGEITAVETVVVFTNTESSQPPPPPPPSPSPSPSEPPSPSPSPSEPPSPPPSEPPPSEDPSEPPPTVDPSEPPPSLDPSEPPPPPPPSESPTEPSQPSPSSPDGSGPSEPAPYIPGGFDPFTPPLPSFPGNTLVPDEDGGFWEFDEDGTPLGKWTWDPDAGEDGEWVFDEAIPLSQLPYTNVDNHVNEYLVIIVSLLLFTFTLILRIRRKRTSK